MSDNSTASNKNTEKSLFAQRFRGYFPVVIDVETAGFNAQTDALLEIAATTLTLDEVSGQFSLDETIHFNVDPAGCQRAIIVAHNAAFDLGFVNAVTERCLIKRSPFHPFVSFDTTTLSGLALGQTVLAKACIAAKIDFNNNEAHSALYDTEKTAELFCFIINKWQQLGGWPLIETEVEAEEEQNTPPQKEA